MANTQTLGEPEADRLYDQYVKPLESIHRGEYVGVSVDGKDGKTVIGATLIDVVRQTATARNLSIGLRHRSREIPGARPQAGSESRRSAWAG